MPIDYERLFEDHGVMKAERGHKHFTYNWTNVECPKCLGKGYPLGFHITGTINCWHCGPLNMLQVLPKLLSLNPADTKETIQKYQRRFVVERDEKEEDRKVPNKIVFPPSTGKMISIHRKYLEKRKFDPDEIERTWSVLGTKGVGDYALRIIIPVILNDKVVTYQGRDITGEQIKYKACAKRDEIIHIKDTLYGLEWFDTTKPGIIVEGATDTWRMGQGNVAGTFGIGITPKQLDIIRRLKLKRWFILLDEDAHEKQALLTSLLAVETTTKIYTVKISGDPGDLKQDIANSLRREIMTKYF